MVCLVIDNINYRIFLLYLKGGFVYINIYFYVFLGVVFRIDNLIFKFLNLFSVYILLNIYI